MAAPPKVTPEARKAILERKAAGFSNREIAVWLSTTLGVEISHVTVRAVALAASASAASKAPSEANTPPKPLDAAKALDLEGAPPGGSDATDLAELDLCIEQLEQDEAGARQNGATQALAVLTRLRLDAIERRRKLRPPAPVEADAAEARAAGELAVKKLGRLVDAECERRGGM